MRPALVIAALLAAQGCVSSCGGVSSDDDGSDDDWSEENGCDARATNGRCFFVDEDGDGIDDLDDDDWDGDQPAALEVTMAMTEAALGPTDELVVDVSDDTSELIDVVVTFAQVASAAVENGASSSFTGAQLGEGYGAVVIDAYDAADNRTTATVSNVLVDLTAPVAEVSSCLIAADGGEFSAWIGDAWALGSVELQVGGVTVASEAFPEWHASFPTEWDWSYFVVPASALPVGGGEATLLVADRVGNTAAHTCALVVDAVPPVVSLDAALDAFGVITATITADDALTDGALLTLTLAARAVPLAQSSGATTTFTLDAADFAAGPLPLEGRARDRAGNEGRSPVVVVLLP